MKLLVSLTSFLCVAAMIYAAVGLEVPNAEGKSVACVNERCVEGKSVACVNERCEVQISNSSRTFTFRGNSNTTSSAMTDLESSTFDYEMNIFDREMESPDMN